MKKKKILSILIMCILVCSFFVQICYSGQNDAEKYTETELKMAHKGVESYTAWYTINNGGYDFYMNRYKSPAIAVAERNLNDPGYVLERLSWRVLTFGFEQEAKYATSEIGYYETFLFNMLYNEENDSFLSEFTGQFSSDIKTFQNYEKLLGATATSSVANAYKEMGCEWTLPETLEEQAKFGESLQKADSIKGALKITGDAKKYIGYAKTATDLINRLAKLQSIINSSAEEGEILEDLSRNATDIPIQLALKEYSAYTKEAVTPEIADSIMTGTVVGSEVLKSVSKNVFDKTLTAAGGYGFAVINAGQEVGKFIANTAFNTEAIMASQYKIDAMYKLETLLQNQLKSYEKDFLANPTEQKAQKFNTALKMYYKMQLESMDCYKEFIDAVYNKGMGKNFFCKDLSKDQYEKMKQEIESIKNSIRETMQSDRELALTLYEEILPEIDVEIDASQKPEKLAPVLTEEEKTIVFDNVESAVMPYSTSVIKSDLTLFSDMEVYGDVYLQSGTLSLNGHKLIVEGNLYQEGGELVVRKGELEVNGSYYIAQVSENEVGEKQYGGADAYLKMMCAEDKVIVHGDFLTKSKYSHSSYLTAGTMYVAGDFIQKGDGSFTNFDATNQHKVVLNGTNSQRIDIEKGASGFATLDIENSSEITVSGYFRANSLKTGLEKINLVSDNMNLTNVVLLNDVDVKGDVHKTSTGSGSNTELNLQGNKLHIEGNLYQESGDIIINKGNLDVDGSYYIAQVSENEVGEKQYGGVYAYLKMMCAEDKVIVHGDFLTKSKYSHSSYLTAGTMYVAGDFIQKGDGSFTNFDATNQHKVVLNGTNSQRIDIEKGASGFATLDIENSSEITVSGYFRANSLKTGLEKINLVSDNMNLTNVVLLNDVDVKGDVHKTSTGSGSNTELNLQGNKLHIEGNLYQESGDIIINKGNLDVDGSYYIAQVSENEVGEKQYGGVYAYLKMMCAEDKVIVHGDFLTKSKYSHSSYLTAGTMYVAGDFIQKGDGSSTNFDATNQHKVVLNGTNSQRIDIEKGASGFATLDIENSSEITVSGYFRANSLKTGLEKINLVSDNMNLTNVVLLNDVDVKGDVHKTSTGSGSNTELNLQGNKLHIEGNLYQESGDIIINKGNLDVDGSYYIAQVSENEVGEKQYGGVYAYLKMMCAEDKVIVHGDFLTKSKYSHSSYLTAGTMYVAGDFIQKGDGSYTNFNATNQHKVVLNGIEPQTVTFENYSSSHFNILQLTQDRSQYTFNPEPCWNEIQENVKVDPEFDNTLLGYGTCGDNAKWIVNNEGVLHIYGTGDTYNYDPNSKDNRVRTPWTNYAENITSVVIEEGITGIGNFIFCGLENVTEIDIPKSVTHIGNGSFEWMGLISIDIPDTVKEIGTALFSGCKNLTQAKFPISVTEIPELTFSGCTGLKGYTVQKQITTIGRSAFEGCDNLETIDLPEGLTKISNHAFDAVDRENSKEITRITFPSTLQTIEYKAFQGCQLEEVVIPDSVTEIESDIFRYCDKLKTIKYPSNLVEFYGGFKGCTSLEKVDIPDSVRVIKMWAFQDISLKLVELPDKLEKIEQSAFAGSKLEDIIIPASVNTIEKGVFNECENLKRITFNGSAPTVTGRIMGNREHSLTNEVYYPANDATWTEEVMNIMGPDATWIPYGEKKPVATGTCGENLTWQLEEDGTLTISGKGNMRDFGYVKGVPWYKYADQITSAVLENGVTSVGEYAFYGLKNMTGITLPEGVKTIGAYAFKNSVTLDNVVLPSTVSKIGESAFYGCSGMQKIQIPEGVYTIWAYTFKNCTNLKEVVLPSTLIKLDEAAFYGCSSIQQIDIPKNVSIIGVYCFKNCSNLSTINLPEALTSVREAAFYGTVIPEITIPQNVKSIGNYAFKNCLKLQEIQLPDNLEKIGDSAFYGNTELAQLCIPDKVTEIGDYAFRKCTKLQSVEFSESLTTIGESSFYGCSSLKEVILPDCVITIKGYAFKSCTALRNVTLSKNLEVLGDSAFYGCTGITNIEIPENVKSMGNYLFSNCSNLKTIIFKGNAPEMADYTFSRVNAEVFYPANDETWSSEVLQGYGGNLVWKSSEEQAEEAEETEAEEVSGEENEESQTEDTIKEETVDKASDSQLNAEEENEQETINENTTDEDTMNKENVQESKKEAEENDCLKEE